MPGVSSWITEPILVVNAFDLPLRVTTGRQAASLLYKGRAVKLNEEGQPIASDVSLSEELEPAEPHVIRVFFEGSRPRNVPAVPRRSSHHIWWRDEGLCQYCGIFVPLSQYEEDHVYPASLGGERTWENLVCCCPKCNDLKANRRLDVRSDWPQGQEPMRLLRIPQMPTVPTDPVVIEVKRHVRSRPFWANFVPGGGHYAELAG